MRGVAAWWWGCFIRWANGPEMNWCVCLGLSHRVTYEAARGDTEALTSFNFFSKEVDTPALFRDFSQGSNSATKSSTLASCVPSFLLKLIEFINHNMPQRQKYRLKTSFFIVFIWQKNIDRAIWSIRNFTERSLLETELSQSVSYKQTLQRNEQDQRPMPPISPITD